MTSEAGREHRQDQRSPKTGDNGSRSEGSARPFQHGADLAALLGATIAAVLTLTGQSGAWGAQSTIIGFLLLIVLLAFFWKRRPYAVEPTSPAGQRERPVEESGKPVEEIPWEKWEPRFVGFALSVVIGGVVALAFAQAFQLLWSPDKGQSECRSVAVAAATKAVRDLSDIDGDMSALQKLINYTWENGHVTGQPTNVNDPVLSYAFYNQYDATVGDCLAGDTFNNLWRIAVPAFLLALVWWYYYVLNGITRKEPQPCSLIVM